MGSSALEAEQHHPLDRTVSGASTSRPRQQDRSDSEASRPRTKSLWRHHVPHPVTYVWAQLATRQQEGEHDDDHEPVHEHWIEQFNDLIMVAFFSRLGHLFVSSGPHKMTNLAMCFKLYILEVQTLHFASYMYNVWLVNDLFTLGALSLVSMGGAVMGVGVGSDAHLPCRGGFEQSPEHLRVFNFGLSISTLAQIAIHIQIVVRERKQAPRLASAICLAGCVLTLPAIFFDTALRWLFMCAVHLVVAIIVMQFSGLAGFLNFSHMQNRVDILILTALGEWVIQVVLQSHTTDMYTLMVEIPMVLVSAILFFNTRPREMVLDLTRKRMFAFVMMNNAIQYLLGFIIFLTAVEYELWHAIVEYHPKGGKVCHQDERYWDFSQAHRGMSPASAGGSHACPGDGPLLTWTFKHARVQRAICLTLMRLILLYLRMARKQQALGEGRIGRKLLVRVLLCFLHLLVPLFAVEFWGCLPEPDGTQDLCCIARTPHTTNSEMHLFLLSIDLFMELSLHHTLHRQFRLLLNLPPRPGRGQASAEDNIHGQASNTENTDTAVELAPRNSA